MKKISLLVLLFLATAALRAGAGSEELIPSSITVTSPAQPWLTAQLRLKVKTLGLNGSEGPGDKPVSRALLLLPNDRARPGVMNFEIEGGSRAGVYQCEALGRGITSTSAVDGWQWGMIGKTKIYYAPEDASDGATIPGAYDLRNISNEKYEIALIGKPGAPEEEAAAQAAAKSDGKPKPYFSGAWRDWYPSAVNVLPVDMIWAADSQAGTQGEGVPFFERRPNPSSAASKARQAAQLAHNPKYYFGPHGRMGFAVHTDSWEDPARRTDQQYEGRPELTDFRWRDTNGCVKLRPACLNLLNEFIAEQAALGRRVQLEVRSTELLDDLPQ